MTKQKCAEGQADGIFSPAAQWPRFVRRRELKCRQHCTGTKKCINMSANIENTEKIVAFLRKSFKKLISRIGVIQIGQKEQFPFGWRKAAKGRTVWRILEELITQNLEANFEILGFEKVKTSESEVSVYDFKCRLPNLDINIFVNVKSSVKGSKTSKDDISKANELIKFYEEDINQELFIATFVINFNDDMTIVMEDCFVMPIAWIPDVYVNPSNNGNLQSSKYKDISESVKRTNKEFVKELKSQIEIANKKKKSKQNT